MLLKQQIKLIFMINVLYMCIFNYIQNIYATYNIKYTKIVNKIQ